MSERVRVLHLFYTFDVEVGGGGLTRFAIELGRNLNPEKFEVILASLGYFDSPQGDILIRELNSAGIHAFEATDWKKDHPYQSFYRSFIALAAELKRHPIDIVHSHSEYTDLTAILLKLVGQAPRIMRTVHYGYQYEWSTKPLRRLLWTNLLYPIMFDIEIGISQTITGRLNSRRIAKVIGRKTPLIHNAIHLERFVETQVDINQKKESLGIPPEGRIVGSVGRLAEQKGYTYLIEAAKYVLNEVPQVYFIVIGDGPLAAELQAQIDRSGISDHFILTGQRSDVEELLPCMELFVSSSLWEGLPTVIMESLASLVPVIATNIPGTNELIQNGDNGLLVPPRDPRKLGQAIISLIKSPGDQKRLALHGAQSVKNYSIENIAKQYEALYLGG